MNSKSVKIVFLAVLFCPFLSLHVLADPCSDRVSRVAASVKDLQLKQRAHVTKEFDAFYLESHAPPARVMISCGPKILSFDAEWSGGSLAIYGGLVEQISQSLDLGSDDFLSSLKTCWSRAALDDDDDEGTIVIPTSRAQISCVDRGGTAQISVNRPQQ